MRNQSLPNLLPLDKEVYNEDVSRRIIHRKSFLCNKMINFEHSQEKRVWRNSFSLLKQNQLTPEMTYDFEADFKVLESSQDENSSEAEIMKISQIKRKNTKLISDFRKRNLK
ncbi:hypothetical protein SS50377_22728 [Spironucleus salmonicida]|uniref:Uncharacterized protein n=1 Tax=Spironucleus salmonicida TaxID=348837 RepID=V6LTV9_9EUKA|nr:hypothetical protein SS50377_22728 [Spironucleus salmonicida]|eukprot:EST44204.1 Hypothetical protein SS50377_16012 [Spironucleus salmonicida]